MINKPSLLDTPNLINAKEYTPSDIPGQSVDDCYANDSVIRYDYDGTDASEWNTGKQVQETLPAAEWDAWMHDLSAFGWQITELLNSMYGELYSAINGQQTGMPHELLDKFNAIASQTETITNKTIPLASNDITGTANKMLQTDATGKVTTTSENASDYVTTTNTKTITNKTISFDDNTLTGVASTSTAQTLTNKTIDFADNVVSSTPFIAPANNASITIDKIKHIVFTADSTQLTYAIGNAPYSGYELRITATVPKAISILVNGQQETKNLSVGVHHITWQDSTQGWTFYELSGEYYNETTFSFLI